MSIEFTNIPFEWKNKGVEPPDELKNKGWQPMQKPTASYFNAQWSRVNDCLKELQVKLSDYATLNDQEKEDLSAEIATKLDSSEFTAERIIEVLNAASGSSGSGLNADTLDGKDSSAFSEAGHTHTFESLTSKPTTISGYGITDSVGKKVAGQTFEYPQGTTVTAGTGAEIFNDYRARTYNSDGTVASGNVASGQYSHAEGIGTTATSGAAHAEGANTTAKEWAAHAEGQGTIASQFCAHAEGNKTTASGVVSHAEGQGTIASGDYSHAEGLNTTASGAMSHAGGLNTIANQLQLVHGKHNKSSTGANSGDTSGDIFIIGNGTSDTTRSNAFRLTAAGKAYGLSNFSGSGAGAAELYEWVDGNPDNEDRRGLFVTLEGEKIRIATPKDEYILGVIDPCPYVVGDVQSEIWKDMYLKDVFGEKLIETVEVEETTDESGVVIPAHTEKRWILNPEYDPTQKYISRDDRSEFVAITSKGKVVLIDDGSCQVNKYCTVGENGIATASDDNYAVRVMERLDDTHIRVYIDSVFINKKS